MFILGHTGFGSTLARPFARSLPWRWLLLGTLLPDLIDKPLYYGLCLATGRAGADLGLISGTRTFGHTALFVVLLGVLALRRRSPLVAALALGAATHAPIDIGMDLLGAAAERSALLAFVFPLAGLRFGVVPFRDPLEHLSALRTLPTLVTEALGAGLLIWGARRRGATASAASPCRRPGRAARRRPSRSRPGP